MVFGIVFTARKPGAKLLCAVFDGPDVGGVEGGVLGEGLIAFLVSHLFDGLEFVEDRPIRWCRL